ncbi:MAG: hypothetical protein ACXABY_25650 [Candidatus Thorarchaeota archaeon]|jgi:hypothetical protein
MPNTTTTRICRMCNHDCGKDCEGLHFDHTRHICMDCAQDAFGVNAEGKRKGKAWYDYPDPNEDNDGS